MIELNDNSAHEVAVSAMAYMLADESLGWAAAIEKAQAKPMVNAAIRLASANRGQRRALEARINKGEA